MGTVIELHPRPTPPKPCVSEAVKRELGRVIAVLDDVIPQFGDLDEWHHAFIGVRGHLRESCGLPFDPGPPGCSKPGYERSSEIRAQIALLEESA